MKLVNIENVKPYQQFPKITMKSKRYNNLNHNLLLVDLRRLCQAIPDSLDPWLGALPTCLEVMIRLLLLLLQPLWPRFWREHRTRRPAFWLESPTWPQQLKHHSKMLDTNWIQKSSTSIQPTKKTQTRRSSPSTRLWTPILLMTLLFAMASGTKIVLRKLVTWQELCHTNMYSHQPVISLLFFKPTAWMESSNFMKTSFVPPMTNDNTNATVYQPVAKVQDYAYINRVFNTINMAGQYNVTNTHIQNMKSHRSRIQDLLELFPNVDATPEETAHHKRFIKTFLWEDEWLLKLSVWICSVCALHQCCCFVFQLASLISGVWGTYNGIYTHQQLDQLHRDLTNVEEKQDQLFAISNMHNNAIIQLNTSISTLLDSSMRQIANPSRVTDVTLQRLVDMLDWNIGKAQRAIQATQMRWLSVDFLYVDQLHDLHAQCLVTAKMYDSKLIVEYPLDFFQIELSYIYTKDDIVLVLHIPMVPTDALLQLMRYWSFLIPLQKDDFTNRLLPRLDHVVLTISNSKEQLLLEVKFSDLMECHQLNSIYLCDHHGVLDQSAGDLCIGALYSQQLDAALTFCPMEVVWLSEAILPLSRNCFVILNNPTGFNRQKDCVNGPSSELSLPKLQKHWNQVAPWSFMITSSLLTPQYISKPTTTNMNGTGALRSLLSHLIISSFRKSWTYTHHRKVCLVSPMWSRRSKLNRTGNALFC